MANESRKIMGYRSEVALSVTTDAAFLLKELCEHNTDLKEIIEEGLNGMDWNSETIRNGHEITFYWTDIKWYDSYPGIVQIQAFMDNYNSDEWRFIRIGEDIDDNIEDGYFYDSGIYINRSIEGQ